MKISRLVLFLAALAASLFPASPAAWAQTTAFTYQGSFADTGRPATGSYDLQFALYDAPTNGTQIGATLTNLATGVTNGLFMVTLDFGVSPYTGRGLWLQIAARTNGAVTFIPLTPLQPLTSTPYSIYAANAGGAASAASVAASNIVGAIPAGNLPAVVLTNGESEVNLTGAFTGNGGALTNIPTSALTPTYSGATNSYAMHGTYIVTVPAGAGQMTVKLWGGGGGCGYGYSGYDYSVAGGGGAFSEVTLNVIPGQTYVVVTGQGGGAGPYPPTSGYGVGGGAGSNDGAGGAGSPFDNIFSGGGGGQASSLFLFNGSSYIMKAVAGGGGGGSGEYGSGGGGQAGGSGVGYAANATTTGVTNLNLIGGDGQDTPYPSLGVGGGGGGYGGGQVNGGGITGGGGSYGTITVGGGGTTPGNTNDASYIAGSGAGGGPPSGGGSDGLAVVTFGPILAFSNTVQAGGFAGDGSTLTNLQVANLTGTISASQLPSDVALLDQSPVFTTPVGVNNGLRLNNTPIYLRAGTDTNHGLAYAGTGVYNFGTNQPDGPVLWGFTGGVLGTLSTGSPAAALSWNSAGVTVNGSLSAGSFSGNGGGLTNLNGARLTGTLTNPISSSGTVSAALFSGNGGGLTNLNASNVTGTLTNPISTSGTVSAALFSGNGGGLTNLNASNITGTLTNPISTSGTISAGLFSGNGGGLTNLNTSNLFTTTVVSIQTNVYSSAGTNVFTVPAGVSQMTVKLWGAGGGAASSIGGAAGGGGAFVQQTLNVSAGQSFTVVVGQHGDYNDNNGGGNGSGDAAGGSTPAGQGSGQGGQASSLFYFNGTNYITEAVAGGGGGGSAGAGGAGGNPGQTGGSSGGAGGNNGVGGAAGLGGTAGNNYAAGATNTGISSLSLANGNGAGTTSGNGVAGGGGGFGGGGRSGTSTYGGGGGGGSYGTIIIGGNNSSPGNTGDPTYLASHGVGGAPGNGGTDGLVVVVFSSPVAVFPGVVSATRLTVTNIDSFTDTVALYNNNNASAFGILNSNGTALAEMGVAVGSGQFSTTAVSNDVVLRASLGGTQKLLLQAGNGVANIIISNTTTIVQGTFNNNSDRNAKKDFAPVSASEILDKVAGLPLSKWSYKTETGTRHVGPMAQDFYSAFNVGTDDQHIAPIDEGGVALAAIQGLNQKLNAENAALKAELEALRAEIKQLEENQKSAP